MNRLFTAVGLLGLVMADEPKHEPEVTEFDYRHTTYLQVSNPFDL